MKSVIIVIIVNPYPNYLHESKLQVVTVVEVVGLVSNGVPYELADYETVVIKPYN